MVVQEILLKHQSKVEIALIGLFYSTLGFSWGFTFWGLPLAPSILACYFISNKLSFWKRFGIIYGCALLTSLVALLFQTIMNSIDGNMIRHSWLVLPMAIEAIVLSLITKKEIRSKSLAIVVGVVVMFIIFSVERGLVSGMFSNASHSNLLGKDILFHRLIIEPIFTMIFYGGLLKFFKPKQ